MSDVNPVFGEILEQARSWMKFQKAGVSIIRHPQMATSVSELNKLGVADPIKFGVTHGIFVFIIATLVQWVVVHTHDFPNDPVEINILWLHFGKKDIYLWTMTVLFKVECIYQFLAAPYVFLSLSDDPNKDKIFRIWLIYGTAILFWPAVVLSSWVGLFPYTQIYEYWPPVIFNVLALVSFFIIALTGAFLIPIHCAAATGKAAWRVYFQLIPANLVVSYLSISIGFVVGLILRGILVTGWNGEPMQLLTWG